MEKQKNSEPSGLDNSQLLLIGLVILLLVGAGGIVGGLIELVIGIVGGVIGLVVGLIGAVIGIVFGLLGAVLGIVGAIIGIVVGTAVLWVPLLIIAMIIKSISTNEEKPKRKRTINV